MNTHDPSSHQLPAPAQQQTFDVLSAHPAPVAIALLREATKDPHVTTRQLAWRSLVERPYADAHAFLIDAWPEAWTDILEACQFSSAASCGRTRPSWASSVVDAIASLAEHSKTEGWCTGGSATDPADDPGAAAGKPRAAAGNPGAATGTDPGGVDEAMRLIEIAEMTAWSPTISPLIAVAINHPAGSVRHHAAATVLGLVGSLGRRTRQHSPLDRVRLPDQSVRRSLLAELRAAVEVCIERIGLDGLVRTDAIEAENGVAIDLASASEPMVDATTARLLADAFLALSSWHDQDLRDCFQRHTAMRRVLCHRLTHSLNRGVINLLAESLHRRRVPRAVLNVVMKRTDASFGHAWLDGVSATPRLGSLSRLRERGLPEVLPPGRRGLPPTKTHHDAAIAWLNVAAHGDQMETLALLIRVFHRNGINSRPAVIEGMARCQPPTWQQWAAAASVTDTPPPLEDTRPEPPDAVPAEVDSTAWDEATTAAPDARPAGSLRDAAVLHALTAMLHATDVALAAAASRVLQHFTMAEVLPHLACFDERARRRVGRAVLRVDVTAIDLLRDHLRHPVLQRRLHAIDVTASLDLVDEVIEPLEKLARHDHQSARLRVAEVLAVGTTEASQTVLQCLASSPQASIRETAIASLHARGMSVT